MADSIALVLHYASAVCRLAGFDEQRIIDYVIGTVCKTANDADSASDSLSDFLDKISALHSQSVVGEWNIRLITTRTGFEGLAVNMSSVWAKVDGTYKVPYSRKVIESQIAQAGGVLKSAQKFYRSEDEVKSYRRSLINGHNESVDYVPPKPPEETTRKCVLIPLSLVKDFISSWRDDDSPPDGGGGGNVPSPDPITPSDGGTAADSVVSYPRVDGNLSEKGNFANGDCTMVSDDDSTPSYLFKEDTQSLNKENEQGVEILSEEHGGENIQEIDTTFSFEVTKTETDTCNPDIIEDVAVASDELPSLQESENEVTTIAWEDVVSAIDSEMTRLGWVCDRGQRHIIEKYGVRSRIKLSDDQLLEFLGYLKSLPTFKVGQTVLFQGMRVVIERLINQCVAVVRSFENPKQKSFEAAITHISLI